MALSLIPTSVHAQETNATEKILREYNLLSFSDAQASHIVGNVLIGGRLYHSTERANIDYASLSKGISSYVGNTNGSYASYFYDISKDPQFKIPKLYTNMEYGGKPNGEGEVVVGDHIDFNELKEKILSESNFDTTKASSLEAEVDIEMGKVYYIDNINEVNKINFIGEVTSKQPTVLNIVGEWNTIPNIYLNGEPFNGNVNPESRHESWFGEGHSIVWNAPFTSSELNRKTIETDIIGHIVAPNADFVNEGGGNLNGSAIVNKFIGRGMELHSFPYIGDYEPPVDPDPETPEPPIDPPVDPEPPVEPETPDPPVDPEPPVEPEKPEPPTDPEVPPTPEKPDVEVPKEPDPTPPPIENEETLPQTGGFSLGTLGIGLVGLGTVLIKKKKD